MKNLIIYENNKPFNLIYDSELTFEIPEHLKAAYDQALTKWEKIVQKNSVRAKPFKYVQDNNATNIIAGPFSYVQTRAWQECLSNEESCSYADLNKEISSISLTVSVISHDGLMLCALRSPQVSRYPSMWSVGLGEGLEDFDFQQANLNPSVKRCLAEELNIIYEDNLPEFCIQYPAISFNKENSSLNILAVANFSEQGMEYHSDNILLNFKNAPDAWEHTALSFIEPSFEAFESTTNQCYVPGSQEYFRNILKTKNFHIE